MSNRWVRYVFTGLLMAGLCGGSFAGTLDVPTKYALSSSQKSSIINWLNSASQAELLSANLSSSVAAKVLATRPYGNWDAMWVTSSVGSNTTVQYALIKLGIYGPLAKTATTWPLASSDKSAITSFINSASEASLTTAGFTASNIKKILVMRPFRDFDHIWAVSGVGSNANVKNALIAADLFINIYDYKATRAPLRTRVGDRTKVTNWLNSASAYQMSSLKITTSGQEKIPMNRPFTWKKALSRLSEGDLQKVGVQSGAMRYVSGSKAIERISGIGAAYAAKLRAEKLYTVQGLLMASVWPEWRAELAAKTGIAEALIVRFAKRADLDRVTNVGEQYGDLLAWAGVETVPQLAAANPTALRDKMIEMNLRYNLVNTMPSLTTVNGWVNKAKTLPQVLEF